MIELEMVRQMIKKGLLVAPFLIIATGALTGLDGALSVAIGLSITVANLWIGGRIVGGLAENHPDLLMAGAMAALGLALVVTGGALAALQRVDSIDFPLAAVALVGSHLALVTWEAADRLLRLPPAEETTPMSNDARTRR